MLLRFQVLQALSTLMQELSGTSLTPKQNVLASVHPKAIPGTEIGQRQTQERCPFAVVRALQTLMQALSGTMPMPRQNAPAFVKEKECNGMVSGRQQSKVKCPCAGAFSNQIRVPKIKVL